MMTTETAVKIDAKQVKELREKSGAPMGDCLKALQEANGDMENAFVVLRKRGMASAAKKASRTTNEGAVGTYIHAGGKIGVLVELNCESDFVARTEDFQELLRDIAMHIAATDPRFVSRDEVTEADLEREKDVYRSQAAASGKPANIVEKMLEGKLAKFYEEFCLLDQPFIKEQTQTIAQIIATKVGEARREYLRAPVRALQSWRAGLDRCSGEDCSRGAAGIGLRLTSAAHRARATARALSFACNARSADGSNPTPAVTATTSLPARKEHHHAVHRRNSRVGRARGEHAGTGEGLRAQRGLLRPDGGRPSWLRRADRRRHREREPHQPYRGGLRHRLRQQGRASRHPGGRGARRTSTASWTTSGRRLSFGVGRKQQREQQRLAVHHR